MKNDYSELIKFIGEYNIYEEEDHIYFLPTTPICNANMLIQEKDDYIVIWDNEISTVNHLALYKKMNNTLSTHIVFPYVDSEILLHILNELQAEKFNFHDEQEKDYNNNFGSYILYSKKYLNEINFSEKKEISEEQLYSLFESVSWNDICKCDLKLAINNSSHIITAWDRDTLVGLIRSMDDNIWSATIDCLIVHKNYQNKGIGSTLVKKLLEKINHIKYISVAPNNSKNNNIYCKYGFCVVKDSSLLQIKN